MTGYPSIDKPWLKYYSEEAIHAKLPECTMYEYIHRKNERHLNDIALIYFKKKITYAQLFNMIETCSHSLSALGIGRGDIVTIHTLNMPQVVVLLYALSHIGAIANNIFITTSAFELRDILLDTKSKLYVTIDSLFPKYAAALEGTSVERCVLLSPGEEADVLTNAVIQLKTKKKLPQASMTMSWRSFMQLSAPVTTTGGSELPVVMVYTGGTTGKSKIAVLTNSNLNSVAFQEENAQVGFSRGDTFLDTLPMFIAFGLTVSLHLPLSLGVKTVMLLDITQNKAGDYLAKYKPNYFVGGCIHLEKIITHPKLQKMDLSYLKLLAAGGEAVPTTLEHRANAFLKEHNSSSRVIVGYGMTELSATVCTGSAVTNKVGTVGIPLPNVTVKIVEPDTYRELGFNEEGEICINSPSTMAGYYHKPQETANVIRRHPDGLEWVHTGDIGQLDEDGFLTVVGRIKRIIEILDNTAIFHKVYPKLVEEALMESALVDDIAIVGRPASVSKNEAVAFVVPCDANAVEKTIDMLRTFAAEHLCPWEQPVEYRIVKSFPRTIIGKIDYRALEAEAANH